MQRATNVRPSPKKSRQRKNPPTKAGGLKHSVARAIEQPRFSDAFRLTLQGQQYVLALMRIDARIAAGERVEETGGEGLRSFYRECWRIYEAGSDYRVRRAFDMLMGVPWWRFESAIDALGWRLLPVSRRASVETIGGIVQFGDVAGFNEYEA